MKCLYCKSAYVVQHGEPYVQSRGIIQEYLCKTCHRSFKHNYSQPSNRFGLSSHQEFFNLTYFKKLGLFILLLSGMAGCYIINKTDPQISQALNSAASPTGVSNHISPLLPSPSPTPKALPKFDKPVQELPNNGDVSQYWQTTPEQELAPLKVVTQGSTHTFIKVVDDKLDKTVLTLFVRAGETAQTKVPLGTYTIKYASGSKWYGEKYAFGPDGVYSKAEKQFKFKIDGNRVMGSVLYLYPRIDGNLRSQKINSEEF